jgi:hypothetical protein
MPERRSEPRMMCADMVEVQWKDDAGRLRTCTALLEDISTSGACLQLDGPVSRGTTVEIEYRGGRLEGSVCYCFFRDIGYWVGVQFTPKTKWSRQQFRPRHLLDVRKLLGRFKTEERPKKAQ